MTEKKIRLKAQRIGYSSVVGGGLMLSDPAGRSSFIINIIGTTQGVTKEENNELVEQIEQLIADAGGLLVSPRDE